MFFEDGRWKEFGTISSEHTLVPFWLFCIVWAIVSYLITLLFVGEYRVSQSTLAAVGATAAAAAPTLYEDESPEDLVMPLPPRTKGRNNVLNPLTGNMKPGYYVLDTKGMKRSGIPKYIYIGEEPTEEFSSTLDE